MRIKLSKQNWRLVGQKMGWLKRAQLETGAGGVTSTGAMEAMGLGKDKITPGSLGQDTGNVNIHGMDKGIKEFTKDLIPITTPEPLQLKLTGQFTFEMFNSLRNLKDMNEGLQYLYLGNKNPPWEQLARGYDMKNSPSENKGIETLNKDSKEILYTGERDPRKSARSQEQLMAFNQEWNRVYSNLLDTKRRVAAAFKLWWASQPHPENNGGLDFGNGPVKP